MRVTHLLPLLALTASPLSAVHAIQTGSRTATDSAKAFSLDLPAATPTTDATPPSQTEAALPHLPAAAVPEAAPATFIGFTLDTPIAQLLADRRAKAVLDRDLPGLSDDPNLLKFASVSLRQFQPMTGGQLTDTLLAKTGSDLAALGGAAAVPPAAPPLVVAPTRDRKLDSGR